MDGPQMADTSMTSLKRMDGERAIRMGMLGVEGTGSSSSNLPSRARGGRTMCSTTSSRLAGEARKPVLMTSAEKGEQVESPAGSVQRHCAGMNQERRGAVGEQEKWVILPWCLKSILYNDYHSTEQ